VDTIDNSFIQASAADVLYICTTTDDVPNPWDTVSTNLASLLSALEVTVISGGTGFKVEVLL
jgi:hypothetical protein